MKLSTKTLISELEKCRASLCRDKWDEHYITKAHEKEVLEVSLFSPFIVFRCFHSELTPKWGTFSSTCQAVSLNGPISRREFTSKFKGDSATTAS